jgi:hypothetical protein
MRSQSDLGIGYGFYQQQYIIFLEEFTVYVEQYNIFLMRKLAENIDRFNVIRTRADSRLKQINISPTCQQHWHQNLTIYGRHISNCALSTQFDMQFMVKQLYDLISQSQKHSNEVIMDGLAAYTTWNPLIDRETNISLSINRALWESLIRFIDDYEEIAAARDYAAINYYGITRGFERCIGTFVGSFDFVSEQIIQAAEASVC